PSDRPEAARNDHHHSTGSTLQVTLRRGTARDVRGLAAIELFLDMIATERGASKNTIEAYRRDLEDYAEFLAAKGSGIASAVTDDVRAYLAALVKRGMAANSSARKLSAIRQLHRFLYAEGKRQDDPAAVLEGPRRGRALPKVLSIEEVTRLFEAARVTVEKAGDQRVEHLRALRLVCLLEALYATGFLLSGFIGPSPPRG